jgi:hypothetical protein
MRRRLATALAIVALASLATASSALAGICAGEYLRFNTPTWTWGYTTYNYANASECSGQGSPFDCSRFDSSGIATWSEHSNGAYVYFNNGPYSPWRKTGMYNNGTVQDNYASLQDPLC